MADIKFLYKQAELAQAAYAILQEGTINDVSIVQLKNKRFTETQVDIFASHYTVVTQYEDPNGSGFSATVFSDSSGNMSLAIRGTEGVSNIADMETNSHILLEGVGFDQVVVMVNWWNSITAPQGQLVSQFSIGYELSDIRETNALYSEEFAEQYKNYYLESSGSIAASGELVSAIASDSDTLVTVSGHSLGGHLAMAFGAIFPDYTDQVVAFNAPGFIETTVNHNFFTELGGSFPSNDNVINVIANEASADDGFNAIAGLHSQPGEKIEIAIEDQWSGDESDAPGAYNHSQMILTDSLAVYSLMNELDIGFTEQDYKNVLHQVSNSTSSSYEVIVDQLQAVFGLGTDSLPVGNQNREALYAAMNGLDSLVEDYKGQVDIVQTNILSGSAKIDSDEGFAYRYALVNLNPFAITGDVNLYTQHNENGELNIDNFSEQYLEDRALMLAAKSRLYSQDLTTETTTTVSESRLFKDASGIELTQFRGRATATSTIKQYLFGSDDNDSESDLTGGSDDDHIYGMAGDDTLNGGAGSDYLEGGSDDDVLYGGGGADTIIGGEGDDHLYGNASGVTADVLDGGEGFDTYYISSDDGDTIIRDSDLVGSIQFDGNPIGAGLKSVIGNTNIFEDDDKHRYQLAVGNLYITLSTGQKIVVENFGDDISVPKLGLDFGEAEPLAEPGTPSQSIVGDYEWKDFDLDEPGIQEKLDSLGNEIQDFEKPKTINDSLNGSADADLITSGDGNDSIDAKAGGDDVQGGAGVDILKGEEGDDVIQGNAGSDIVYGGEGEDVIYADDSQDVIAALEAQTPTNQKGSLLSGGDDDDTLLGNAGNDTLMGGVGEDILVGSAGDDNLYGDAVLFDASRDWELVRSIYLSGSVTIYKSTLNDGDWERSETDGGIDYLFGGTGNDWLQGGVDNDYLDGGADNDVLFGDEGDDVVLGGDGEDLLNGDSASIDSDYGNDVLDGGAGNDKVSGNKGNDLLYGGLGNDTLNGGEGDDTLYGGEGEDNLYGNEGNDVLNAGSENDGLYGGEGDDTLYGGEGEDNLYGNEGNDVLNGGEGVDYLNGGAGSNTYLINLGDGAVNASNKADTIKSEGKDIVRFGAGISLGSIKAYYSNGLLNIQYSNTDVLNIANGFNNVISSYEFADGTVVDSNTFIAATFSGALDYTMSGVELDVSGGSGGDSILGNELDNRIIGNQGDDFLNGGYGDDTLNGGEGQDTLEGGYGNDIYLLGLGDDQDIINDNEGSNTIIFQEGISLASLSSRFVNTEVGSYLAIDYAEQQTVYIKDGANGNIATYQFSDGSEIGFGELLVATLSEPVEYKSLGDGTPVYGGKYGDTLSGSQYSDTLIGGDGDDKLAGGGGNDILQGGQGHDTYYLGLRSGIDSILGESGQTNTLQLVSGLSVNDLALEKQGNDLYIYNTSNNSGVIISDYYPESQDWLLKGSDGSSVTLSSLLTDIQTKQRITSVEEASNQYIDDVKRFYGNALSAAGYETQDQSYRKSLYSENSTESRTYLNNYVVSLDVISEEFSNEKDITLDLKYGNIDINSTLISSETNSETIDWLDTSVANYFKKGQAAGYYFSLESLFNSADTAAGISLSPEYWAPVYGTESVSELSLDTGEQTVVVGYWYYPDGVTEYSTKTISVTRSEYDVDYVMRLYDISANEQNNNINIDGATFKMVDAGSGNDWLIPNDNSEIQIPRTTLSDLNAPGDFLYGNNGNDTLFGSNRQDILIGGAGNDVLYGRGGGDRYLVFAGDGNTVILDDGTTGQLDKDIVQLPIEVKEADLVLEWVQQLAYSEAGYGGWDERLQTVHNALKISWGTDDSVTIVLPHSDMNAGYGVDYVELADGQLISMDTLVSQTGGHPQSDVHEQNNVIEGIGQLYGSLGNDTLVSQSTTSTYISDFNYDWNTGERSVIKYSDHTRLIGGAGRDTLIGGSGGDELIGADIYEVNDGGSNFDVDINYVYGGMWDEGNTFDGGKGDDRIWSSAGTDVFYYQLGDGNDHITDFLHSEMGTYVLERAPDLNYEDMSEVANHKSWSGNKNWYDLPDKDSNYIEMLSHNTDTLVLGEGISTSDVAVSREGIYIETAAFEVEDSLVFKFSDGGKIIFDNWFGSAYNQLDRVEFNDGTVWEGQVLVDIINGGPIPVTQNRAPLLESSLRDQSVSENSTFEFVISPDSFTDADGDVLSYSASLADGNSLPSWLSFDVATQTFSGTPENNDVGVLSIRVTATDTTGESASDAFDLTVNNINDVPTVEAALADQTIDEDAAFSYTIPADSFSDVDAGDSLSYTATTLADESALPNWLNFDAVSQTFSGTPENGDVGTVTVKVTATDNNGLSVSDEFDITIDNVNDAPTLENAIADQVVTENESFSFRVPADSFVDIDTNDSLSYAATLSDNSALPYWLNFDGDSQTFNGSPSVDESGVYGIKVLATDLTGLSAETTFTLTVNNVAVDIEGTSGNDMLTGTADADTINGNQGDDKIEGLNGDDVIYGSTGNDIISGGNGADTIDGGKGNDTIDGGWGNNTYLFNLDDGEDTITWTRNDQLIFGAGILPSHLSVTQINDTDLIISIVDALDASNSGKITLINAFNMVDSNLLTVSFADTSEQLTGTDLKALALNITGTEGSDTIVGSKDTDTIIGLAGDDNIIAANGNDIIEGGLGNDTIDGGWGNNTYLFNLGDGKDTITWTQEDKIEFGSGITTAQIAVTHQDNTHLVITILDEAGVPTGDEITLNNAFDMVNNNLITVYFADSTAQLTGADLKNRALTVTGTEAADTLVGSKGADTISGLDGNDTITGENGSDIIYGGAGVDNIDGGNGSDVIYGGAGNDVINTGNGNNTVEGGLGNDTITGGWGSNTFILNLGDGNDTVTWTRNDIVELGVNDVSQLSASLQNNTDFKLSLLGSEGNLTGDSITLVNALDMVGSNPLTVRFTDGSELTGAELQTLALTVEGTANDDHIVGSKRNDTLSSLAGNDIIEGGNGDDILDGGAGNDTLQGGWLDDTYLFHDEFGQDTINNYDGSLGDDTIVFSNINYHDLWFSRSGNDLTIDQIGTENKVTVSNWYGNEKFRVSDVNAGTYNATETAVEQLVSAMAAFDAPTGAGSVVPEDVKQQLEPTLTSVWQQTA